MTAISATVNEPFTRQEIYFTGKENIEGYTALVHFFLPYLTLIENASVINVDNKPEDPKKLAKKMTKSQRGELYYEAATKFQDTFTQQIGREGSNITSINVKVDFATGFESKPQQEQVCNSAFSYLGIVSDVEV